MQGLVFLEYNPSESAETKMIKHIELASSTGRDPSLTTGLGESLMAWAQIAQRKGQFAQAQQWLAQVPTDADPIKLASRQADLLTQQGRLDEARQVLERIRANTPELAVRKALVQSQWLRDNKQVANAHALVQQALKSHPQNTDLMSELAMVNAKLKRFDAMEVLLRELMKRKPDVPHSFNALGYSLAARNPPIDDTPPFHVPAPQIVLHTP